MSPTLPEPFRATALRAALLLGCAALLALLANALAGPSRRLAWRAAGPTPRVVPAPPPAPPIATPSEPAPVVPPPTLPSKPPRAVPPHGAQATPPSAPAQPSLPTGAPILELTDAQALAAFQQGAPFLDARRSADFAAGHIRGAWCTPVWESDLEDRLLDFKAARRPGPDDPIVIYCSGGDCRDSHLLAERLLAQGYGRLLIYRDGYPAWVAHDRPVQKGLP